MDKREELKQIIEKGTTRQKRIILRLLQCFALTKQYPNCKGAQLFNALVNDAKSVTGLEVDRRIAEIETAFIYAREHTESREALVNG